MSSTRQARELDLTKEHPLAVELFAGVGGLGLGLEQSGFHVAVAVEIEEITGRYLRYNFPSTTALYGDSDGDVRRFGMETLRSLMPAVKPGEVTLVAGGPPCQGFSLAGKKSNEDPLNDLVLEFARVVLEVRPAAFLMENVPGITLGSSDHLDRAIKDLEKEYRVCEPTPRWACDFGVPQARQRVFLVGIRKDLKIDPSLPEPTHLRPGGAPLLIQPLPLTPSVGEAIGDLPEVDKYPELIDGDRVPYELPPESRYAKIMRGALTDPEDLSATVTWDDQICTNCRRTQHGPDLLERLKRLKFNERDKVSGIGRLNPDDVSVTIRAGTTSERGSWSAPRPLHPFQDRVLTTRECARIQSFPDHFFFHPVKWHGNRMVGNAVPPLLARAIGRHLLKLLGVPRLNRYTSRLTRDESLVAQDILDAANSGLSTRKVSQKVTHPRKKALARSGEEA